MASYSSAHGLGYNLEKVEGDYRVDVGLSEEDIVAGDTVRMSFELSDVKTENPVEFDAVWIRLAQGNKMMFIGTLNQDPFGLLQALSYNFAAAGDYDLTARYQKEGKKLTESTFNLKVSGGASSNNKSGVILGLGGLIVGFLASWFIKK